MAENSQQISFSEFAKKVIEYLRYIKAKWKIVLIASILGIALGITYAMLKESEYKGKLTFVLSGESKSSGFASLAGQIGLDVSGLSGGNGAFEGENIIELLKSKKIIQGAIFKEMPGENELLVNNICESEKFFEAWRKKERLQKLIPFSQKQLLPVQDSLISVIYNHLLKKYILISKPDKKLSFYEVTITSPNQVISAELAKNLVGEAAKMYIETKTKVARSNLNMLRQEADSLKRKLGGSVYASADEADQTFNLNPALLKKRVRIQENQLEVQVLVAAYGEVIKNLEIAKITLQKETPLYQIIDEPTLPLVKIKPGKIKSGIIGGALLAFFCVFGIVVKRLMNQLLGENQSNLSD